MSRRPLTAAIAFVLTLTWHTHALASNTSQADRTAAAASASDPALAAYSPDRHTKTRLAPIVVTGSALPDPRFDEVLAQVSAGKITAAKKTTVTDLTAQPAIVADNFRQVFARTPGIFISEQQVPSFYNVNYRGLGDPHESEFVLFLKDGLPLVSDWLGYATLYAPPAAERIERVEFIRGGATLLYGPQPGPVVNLITRRADPAASFGGHTEQVLGGDNLYATYNEVRGGNGEFGYLAGFDFRRSDGFRQNGDYKVNGFNGSAAWQPSADGLWRADFYTYDSNNGEAGRMTKAQFDADPSQTTSPFNRIWLTRYGASLEHQRVLGEHTALYAKAWVGYFDRLSRRTTNFVAPQPPPTFTQFDRQQFRFGGVDARIQHEWGSNHTLTAGSMLYSVRSPREQSRSVNLQAPGEQGESARFSQRRGGSNVALFAENLFRFGDWSIVPGARIEFVDMFIDETLKLASLNRPAIDRSFERTVPLFGLGVLRELGAHQFYANASQGYRPMRYDDIGNPTAELAGGNDPNVAKALNLEAGFRGAPLPGLFYDISVFNVDMKDRVETRAVAGTLDIERINSGDSRHRGVELQIHYDLLKARDPSRADSLLIFANSSLLDAEITASATPALLGRTPQYAPESLWRAGLIWGTAAGAKLSLTGTWVSAQFWQDSNLATGTGASVIPAQIPAYRVFDLALEYPLFERAQVLAGVNNLSDEVFYSRIRIDGNNGIEPASPRHAYLGFRYQF